MTLEVPEEHREENLKLSADAYVDLFHIQLRDGSNLHIKTGDPVRWNGNDWEAIPLSFSGYEIKSDGQTTRPKLTIANPNGIFTSLLVHKDEYGLNPLHKAWVYRYRVLRRDLDGDRPVYQMLMWQAWNINSISKNYIEIELRNPMDGNNFYIPARQYMPPEFPTVSFR